MTSQDNLFHPVIELPEPTHRARYDRLVGLDDIKARLRKEAALLADPHRLHAWATTHHGGAVAALTLFTDRAPLFVFAGDIGSGKTVLAESFGCDLADFLSVPVYLYRLKLATRGSGLVGEMTSLVGDAFAHMHTMGMRVSGPQGARAVQILVVDEADALIQSREAQQMHHEDRAGVDAFLAGIDSLTGSRLPVIVVLCTNRRGALDPAVMRRSAATFTFTRPGEEQRQAVLTQALDGLGIRPETERKLVELTGPTGDRPGYTFSDLTQRLIPAAVFRAFPDRPVTDDDLVAVAEKLVPTPVFAEES
ncbi:AAA family ATPase [Saccharomonospora iraqiensis]|uniref:AAA family ATPase n=1 Tax=Saccharomonospora iraqiensis TaxID=52698 RepID=UPI0004056362|nr:AAA family ATPase [Saccharomonospora iraqiensis]